MRSSTRYSVLLVTLIVPTLMALWFAQYVIETFFPNVTLIDLGAFNAMGLISGLATGIWWGRSREDQRPGLATEESIEGRCWPPTHRGGVQTECGIAGRGSPDLVARSNTARAITASTMMWAAVASTLA